MNTQRLFFALWPDDATRGSIETARAALFPMSGAPVDAANLHVTLAFLGDVGPEKLPALLALATPAAACRIEFDRVELWSKSKVIVAGCNHVPSALTRRVDELWARLDRIGFARSAQPFRPHITLVRGAKSLRTPVRWLPVSWEATQLRLVQSVKTANVSRYELLD